MNIDDLLDECADRGWLLNNLFQLDDGTWQANLRTATHFTAYGIGESADHALASAMDRIEDAEEFTVPPPQGVSTRDLTFGPETSKTLMEILNLRKSTFRRLL